MCRLLMQTTAALKVKTAAENIKAWEIDLPSNGFFLFRRWADRFSYSIASIESTILIPLIRFNGMHVANKQAPIERTVACAIGIMGIATN